MTNNFDDFVSKYGFGLLFLIGGAFVGSVGGISYFVWRIIVGRILILIGGSFMGFGFFLMIIARLFNPTSLTGILKED